MKVSYYDGTARHDETMRFNFSDRLFRIKLPAEAQVVLNIKDATGETIEKCEADWKLKIDTWKRNGAKRSRVITYEIEASERPNSRKRKYEERDDKMSDDFYETNIRWKGFKFRFAVGDLVEYPDGRKTIILGYNEKGTDPLDEIMEWSQEREDFCRQIANGLDALVLRACSILDQKPEKVARFIDTKGGTLLTFDKKELAK